MENIKHFNVSKDLQVKCWTTHQKNGFCHYAEWNGIKAREKYFNRTWEEFTYQSVLNSLVEKLKKKGFKEKSKVLEEFLRRENKTLIEKDLKGLRLLGRMMEGFLKMGNEKVAEGILKGIARASGVEPPERIKRSSLEKTIQILKE